MAASVAILYEIQGYSEELAWMHHSFCADAHGVWLLSGIRPAVDPSVASGVEPGTLTVAGPDPATVPDLPGWQWAPGCRWEVRHRHMLSGGGPAVTDVGGWLYAAHPHTLPANWSTSDSTSLRKRKGTRVRCWGRRVLTTPATADLLRQAADDGCRPLRRVPTVRFKQPRAVVFVVHGIGVHGHAVMKRKIAVMKHTLCALEREHGFAVRDAAVDFDYVSWHMDAGHAIEDDVLHSDGEDVREGGSGAGAGAGGGDGDDDAARVPPHVALQDTLTSIMLPTIPAVREVVKHTLLDAALYFSPRTAQEMQDCVTRALNRRWALYQACHPLCDFSADGLRVAVFGHSLGGVISFDLLTAEPPVLDLPVCKLFTAGSPIGFFLSVRLSSPERCAELLTRLQARGISTVNLFHTSDPVAFRLSPLFYSEPAVRKVTAPASDSVRDRVNAAIHGSTSAAPPSATAVPMAAATDDDVAAAATPDTPATTGTAAPPAEVAAAAPPPPVPPPRSASLAAEPDAPAKKPSKFQSLLTMSRRVITKATGDASTGGDGGDADGAAAASGAAKAAGGAGVAAGTGAGTEAAVIQDMSLPPRGLATLNSYLHLASAHSCYWDSSATMKQLLCTLFDA